MPPCADPGQLASPGEVIRQVPAIAILPEVAERVLATIHNPASSAADLHRIVSRDPALAARVLKLANSAFYGLPGQIASVERAMVLLGLNAVKNLVLGACLSRMFSRAGETARDLWKHSVSVAFAAQDLARGMKQPLADEVFLCGLIHDAGQLVSLQLFPDQLRETCRLAAEQAGDFCALERRTIGFDHQELGAALTAHWGFPRCCQSVTGYHHRPAALAGQDRLLACVIYAADTICCLSGNHGFRLTASGQALDLPVLREMGIDAPLIDATTARMAELLTVAPELFE